MPPKKVVKNISAAKMMAKPKAASPPRVSPPAKTSPSAKTSPKSPPKLATPPRPVAGSSSVRSVSPQKMTSSTIVRPVSPPKVATPVRTPVRAASPVKISFTSKYSPSKTQKLSPATAMMYVECSDGVQLEVPAKYVRRFSQTLNDLLEDVSGDSNMAIPIPIKSTTMELVINYMNYIYNNPREVVEEEDEDLREIAALEKTPEYVLDDWEKKFVNISKKDLFQLFEQANFLNFKELLELCAQHIANEIKGKTAAQMREYFEIHKVGKDKKTGELIDMGPVKNVSEYSNDDLFLTAEDKIDIANKYGWMNEK